MNKLSILLFILASPPQNGTAEISMYSALQGAHTASGIPYDKYAMTCGTALRKGTRRPQFPLSKVGRRTIVTIYYRGKSLDILLTDTGSYKPKTDPYWFDLNIGAWKKLTNNAAPTRLHHVKFSVRVEEK